MDLDALRDLEQKFRAAHRVTVSAEADENVIRADITKAIRDNLKEIGIENGTKIIFKSSREMFYLQSVLYLNGEAEFVLQKLNLDGKPRMRGTPSRICIPLEYMVHGKFIVEKAK